MNNVSLIGRLTADPELRYTSTNKSYVRITIAVNRNFKNENGEREVDFINCVAWNKTAEILCKYVKKGNRIGISGRIQAGSYQKEDGSRGYLMDVIVENMEFLESKQKEIIPEPKYNEPVEETDPYKSILDEDIPDLY